MNDPKPPQSESVDSARQQILTLVREIEMLADSRLASDMFFAEYLKRVVAALGADAAVLWLLDDRQQIVLRHYIQRMPLGIFENPEARQRYHGLLQEALQSGGVRVYRSGDSRAANMPTPHVLIVGALQQGTKALGVLMILQRSEAPEAARAGYMQFVEQMCNYVPRYFTSLETTPAPIDTLKEQQELRRVLLELHGSLSVMQVAAVAANDGARFLGCDRVSVVEMYGVRPIVRAMSGQESVNRRSNLVRLMARLAETVLATGETFHYQGRPEGLAPQIEELLAEFLDVSRSRLLTIVPLMPREPSPGATEEGPQTVVRKRPLGALVVEQVTDKKLRADFETRLDALQEHVSQALVNARKHQQIPLLSVWEFAGRHMAALKGRRLAQVAFALVALAVVGAGLALVPWDYRVEGKGRLMPVNRQNVFAPWDGTVVKIQVASGEQVKQGQPLVQLQNEELHARWLTTSTELNDKRKQLLAFQAELAEGARDLARQDVVRLRGKIAQTRIEVDGAEKRLHALDELENSLTVRSPLDGVVATFQVEELLKNRPVRRGELLLEIMDQAGPWRLELEVPEQRLGHILLGAEQLHTSQSPIEFVLATATESTYRARLSSIATRSASSEGGGTVVEVFADLDSEHTPDRRIGAEVTAKINCGKRSLGYVLFGDVIEFVRKRFWL